MHVPQKLPGNFKAISAWQQCKLLRRMDQIIQEATGDLEQFLAATFHGYKYYDCVFPKCLMWSDSTPRGITNDSRQTWIWFMRSEEGFYLRPVGPQIPFLGHI